MWSLVGVLALTLAAAAPEAGAPPPSPDVVQVEELFRVLRKDAPREPVAAGELERAYLRALTRSAELLLREVGVTRGAAEQEAAGALRERLEALARRRVGVLPAPDAPGRREALDALAREATSRTLAWPEVEAWLGHAPPAASSLAPRTPAVAPMREPPPPPEAATRAVLAGRQFEGRVEAGELRLARVQVVEELGGNTAGAGLVEVGEWVRLSLELENPSTQPWFSTTAFPDVAGGCVWVDRSTPQVAGEMSPRQTAALLLWVYVAPGCPAGMARTFALTLRDTHRGDAAPARMRVQLRPLDLTPPRIARVQLDVDELGSSDGSRATELKPGVRFELVTDLSVPTPEARSVHVRGYTLPSDATALIARSEFRDEPVWPRASDGLFRAWDDFDGEVVGAEAFRKALGDLKASRAWLATGEQGRLWVAIDVDVTWEAAPEALAAPAPATPAVPTPPATAAVLDLVRTFTGLVPRPVKPSIPGAVEAVSGYELVLDTEGFTQAYEALWPRPNPPATPKALGFTYRTRLYHALPVIAFMAPAVAAAPPPPVQRRVAPPQRLAWAVVDAGVGVLSASLAPPASNPRYWGGAESMAVTEFHLRATVGPRGPVGLLGVRGGSRDLVGIAPALSLTTWVLGAGWRWRPDGTDRYDVTPYAALNRQSRDIAGRSQAYNSLALELGATAHAFFNEHFGVHVDGAWRFDAPGPLEMVDPSGPRIAAGLSVRF